MTVMGKLMIADCPALVCCKQQIQIKYLSNTRAGQKFAYEDFRYCRHC